MHLQTLTAVCGDFVTFASCVLRPASYPGCQRLFMRGFRSSLQKWPVPKAEDVSACDRRSSSSHARKNLWYPGYLRPWCIKFPKTQINLWHASRRTQTTIDRFEDFLIENILSVLFLRLLFKDSYLFYSFLCFKCIEGLYFNFSKL